MNLAAPVRHGAPRQGLPARLERAPHLGAAFALSNASNRARIRSIGSRSRGSLFIVRSSPRRRSPPPPPPGSFSLPCHRARAQEVHAHFDHPPPSRLRGPPDPARYLQF